MEKRPSVILLLDAVDASGRRAKGRAMIVKVKSGAVGVTVDGNVRVDPHSPIGAVVGPAARKETGESGKSVSAGRRK